MKKLLLGQVLLRENLYDYASDKFRKLPTLLFTLICGSNLMAFAGDFTLHGDCTQMEDSTVVRLTYPAVVENWRIVGSVTLQTHIGQGQFVLHGSVEGLTPAILDVGSYRYRCFLEPSEMSLKIEPHRPWCLYEYGTSVDECLSELRSYLSANDSLLAVKYHDLSSASSK